MVFYIPVRSGRNIIISIRDTYLLLSIMPLMVNRWDKNQEYSVFQDKMIVYASDVACQTSPESVWFLSHTPVYTLGANVELSFQDAQRLRSCNIPIYRSSRGGNVTYHGPEQRMIYPIIHIKHRGLTVLEYIDALELWIIRVLQELGVKGQQHAERRGVWVDHKKICALGIQVKQGVTLHGMALNMHPASEEFAQITPCGLGVQFGVVSLQELGVFTHKKKIDALLLKECPFMCLI